MWSIYQKACNDIFKFRSYTSGGVGPVVSLSPELPGNRGSSLTCCNSSSPSLIPLGVEMRNRISCVRKKNQTTFIYIYYIQTRIRMIYKRLTSRFYYCLNISIRIIGIACYYFNSYSYEIVNTNSLAYYQNYLEEIKM